MSELTALLNNLRARFDAAGLAFAIGGAFALAARGHPRFTDDLDVMVLGDLAAVHRALRAPPERYEYVNEVTFRDTQTLLYLDLLPVQDEAQREAFAKASLTALEGSQGVRVLTPDGAALMLLREATKGNPKKRPLRLRDVELLALDGALDWAYLRTWSRRMGYDAAYLDVRAPGKPPLS